MVKAYISQDGFTIDGHAEYAGVGYDIVCSAISALTQSVTMALEHYTKTVTHAQIGLMSVNIINTSIEVPGLLYVLEIGLSQIAKEYPQHLKVEIIKRRD